MELGVGANPPGPLNPHHKVGTHPHAALQRRGGVRSFDSAVWLHRVEFSNEGGRMCYDNHTTCRSRVVIGIGTVGALSGAGSP